MLTVLLLKPSTVRGLQMLNQVLLSAWHVIKTRFDSLTFYFVSTFSSWSDTRYAFITLFLNQSKWNMLWEIYKILGTLLRSSLSSPPWSASPRMVVGQSNMVGSGMGCRVRPCTYSKNSRLTIFFLLLSVLCFQHKITPGLMAKGMKRCLWGHQKNTTSPHLSETLVLIWEFS